MNEKLFALRNRLFFQAKASSFEKELENVIDILKITKDSKLLADLAADLGSYMINYLEDLNEDSKKIAEQKIEQIFNILNDWNETELIELTKNELNELKESNLIHLTNLGVDEKLSVRWGNDNGLGIVQAMRRGAMFVTTNPPIVNGARKQETDYFDRVRDDICKKYDSETVEQKVSRFTANVVLENCKALYPIFEKSKERYGYVHYQVNPYISKDAQAMADEILFVYSIIQNEIGGKPNVLFKVPGTKAALKTVEMVTKLGIGVTITVNFSSAQSLAFAERIQQGNAERSLIVMMAGRLDGPVEKDLEAAGIPEANLVARGASRSVMYQIYHNVLKKNNLDKTNILTASIRGPWNFQASYSNDLDSDVIISAFPDKWQEYDKGEQSFEPLLQVEPDYETINILNNSDTFKKAYEIDGLTEDEFDEYGPVMVTLSQFCSEYDELKEYLK